MLTAQEGIPVRSRPDRHVEVVAERARTRARRVSVQVEVLRYLAYALVAAVVVSLLDVLAYLGSLEDQPVIPALVLAGVAAGALIGWLWRPSLHSAVRAVERNVPELQERLSSALEVLEKDLSGLFTQSLVVDAADHGDDVNVVSAIPFVPPNEAKLIVPCLIVLLILAMVPYDDVYHQRPDAAAIAFRKAKAEELKETADQLEQLADRLQNRTSPNATEAPRIEDALKRLRQAADKARSTKGDEYEDMAQELQEEISSLEQELGDIGDDLLPEADYRGAAIKAAKHLEEAGKGLGDELVTAARHIINEEYVAGAVALKLAGTRMRSMITMPAENLTDPGTSLERAGDELASKGVFTAAGAELRSGGRITKGATTTDDIHRAGVALQRAGDELLDAAIQIALSRELARTGTSLGQMRRDIGSDLRSARNYDVYYQRPATGQQGQWQGQGSGTGAGSGQQGQGSGTGQGQGQGAGQGQGSGAGQGQGSGAGQGQGSGAGQGQGQGSGAGQGQGAGQGPGQGLGSGAGQTPAGVRPGSAAGTGADRQSDSVMERLTREYTGGTMTRDGATVAGSATDHALRPGISIGTERGRVDAGAGGTYDRPVFQATEGYYSHAVEDAMSRETIPYGYKMIVKKYFGDLAAQGGEAGG